MEKEVGKQLSLEKLEPFRNQKNGKGEHVLDVSRHLVDGREEGRKEERKLAHFASVQCCSKEQVKTGEAQVESPAGLARREATTWSQGVS